MRKKYSSKFKAKVALEALSEQKTLADTGDGVRLKIKNALPVERFLREEGKFTNREP